MTDYYNRGINKVADFCIGFFGGIFFNYVLGSLIGLVSLAFQPVKYSDSYFTILIIGGTIIQFILSILAAYYVYKKGRKWITWGIVGMFIIPILLILLILIVFWGYFF